LEKRGLGKGLGALIPGAGREERQPTDIPIDLITFSPYQPRKSRDDEKFQELVRSVRLHGILQPIVVRSRGERSYELVAGERRLRAASEAGLTRIPAVIKEFTNEQSIEVSLIENLQREDIGPLEAAAAYRRLIDEFGVTQDDIAFRIGKSRPSIANTLRLLNLPEEIQQSLAAGQMAEGHARALLAIMDPEQQRDIWRRVVRDQLTVRETERLGREAGEGPVSRETPSASQHSAATRDRGKIEIEFYTEDELTRILGLLGAV
jgi:ParB family chromosome partitioning protein